MHSNSKHPTTLAALLSLGLLASSSIAQAALITAPPVTGTLVINFDAESGFDADGAVQIGDVIGHHVSVASSNPGNGLYVHFSGWGLVDNGSWENRTYVGLNSHDDIMTFAINDAPVSSVGGHMNYARGCCGNVPLVITALDAGMQYSRPTTSQNSPTSSHPALLTAAHSAASSAITPTLRFFRSRAARPMPLTT